ncbi:hypothetical protein ABZP36_004401 [Zizania latifolia]
MKGSQSHELETDIPASQLWQVYGTLRAAELLPELLPHILAKVEVVAGDGGVGTVLQLTFPPGIPGLQRYKERFVRVDNENYVKEAEAIDGDILKLGFLSYMIRFEIIQKGPSSSVIRSTVEYEIGDGHPELQAMVRTPGSESLKEKFTKIDNENYIKETEVIEGGFLDHGFQKYSIRLEIIAKTDSSSITRSTIDYEVDDASKSGYVSTSVLATIAEAATKYIKEQRSTKQAAKQTSDEAKS